MYGLTHLCLCFWMLDSGAQTWVRHHRWAMTGWTSVSKVGRMDVSPAPGLSQAPGPLLISRPLPPSTPGS